MLLANLMCVSVIEILEVCVFFVGNAVDSLANFGLRRPALCRRTENLHAAKQHHPGRLS